MKDLSHQADELWEKVSRLYNIRGAEKEIDQTPTKFLQLPEPPLQEEKQTEPQLVKLDMETQSAAKPGSL